MNKKYMEKGQAMGRSHSMGIILMNILSIIFLAGCNNQADFYVETEETAAVKEQDQMEEKHSMEEKNSMEEISVYVHVSGAVKAPGVYEMKENSRVYQAVEQAGGFTEDADRASVNQAQLLSDGQMIYIRTIGEGASLAPAADSGRDDGKVNINTADAEELMTLPGIGRSKADSMIAYREANGGFAVIEDIMKIEGIKEGVFSKIKDSIKVN